MKKVLFLAAVLVAALAFTSCKKKCTCTDPETGKSEKVELDKKYFSNCQEMSDAMSLVSDITCK